MSEDFTRECLRVVIAKICQTIGWHSIQSTPLAVMIDILRRYLLDLARTTVNYAVQFGRSQPNLNEVGLAFRDMHVNVADLEEYITFVDSAPALLVPEYPVRRESHLNFLKPGSHEVVTRPVHIYEYLPPMLPEVKEEPVSMDTDNEANNTAESSSQIFKRPADISPGENAVKRPRVMMEEEGRPTREISSVMMTTSGFLSPAREGKLPEARTPITTMDSPLNSLPMTNSFEQSFQRKMKKVPIDKKNDKSTRILLTPMNEILQKKYTTMKDVVRLKALKANVANANALANAANANAQLDHPVKPVTPKPTPLPKIPKVVPKAVRPEKTSPPAPQPKPPVVPDKFIEGKISSEPDKSKLNIFKKISKVKDDKIEKIEKSKIKEEPKDGGVIQSRESSPDLIIDETDKNADQKVAIKQEITIKQEPIEKPIKLSPPVDVPTKIYDIKNSPPSEKDYLFDDESPPGTPSTPKTPEMPTQSPPLKPEKELKRKRKDKTKVKNKIKVTKYPMSPRRNKNDSFEAEMDRPKTPNDPVNIKEEPIIVPPLPPVQPPVFPFFPGYIPGPGLIPSPIFPRLPLAAGMPKHGFGQPAHIHPAMPTLPFVPPIKPQPPEEIPEKPPTPVATETQNQPVIKQEKVEPPVTKEKHKKDKKDKLKKKNKKDKIKNKNEKRKLKEEKKEKEKEKIKREKKEKKKEKEREQHEGSVPKLTLKIGSPRPPTPDVQVARKIMIKPVVKKEEEPVTSTSSVSNEPPEKREPSPELAKISALITRPPKLKTSKDTHGSKEESGTQQSSTSPKQSGPLPGRSRIANSNKGPSVANCGPIAGVKAGPGKQKPVVLKQQPSSVVDNDGNKVWICPGCGGQDDGSPMIGCDDCDAWYHWVCVGIQVPPDDNEDWYCRICIVKKQETLQMDKKKKRKKKEKKEH